MLFQASSCQPLGPGMTKSSNQPAHRDMGLRKPNFCNGLSAASCKWIYTTLTNSVFQSNSAPTRNFLDNSTFNCFFVSANLHLKETVWGHVSQIQSDSQMPLAGLGVYVTFSCNSFWHPIMSAGLLWYFPAFIADIKSSKDLNRHTRFTCCIKLLCSF